MPIMARFAHLRDDGGELRRIAAAHVQGVAKSDDLLDAGVAAKRGREGEEVRAGDAPSSEFRGREDIGERAAGEQVTVGQVGEPVAALGFIHVMGGDEDRETAGGELMNLVPEFAAGLGVDAGSGFVEEQKFRLVDEASGEGEALFPAAGKLPSELVAAVREPEALEAALDRCGAIGHRVNAGDKIEVFANTQVFVITEFLRHVADVALDLGLLLADIETEASARAGVGREEAAQHTDERRFAGAIGSQKTVDLAAAHREVDGVDDDFVAEALGDASDVDCEVVFGRGHAV